MGHGFSELLQQMSREQEQGYIALQRKEWAPGTDFPTRSHHQFSGVPYHHVVGKMYDSARLGVEYVEDLPEDKVV
jgi:isocitrate lyase